VHLTGQVPDAAHTSFKERLQPRLRSSSIARVKGKLGYNQGQTGSAFRGVSFITRQLARSMKACKAMNTTTCRLYFVFVVA